MNEKAKLMTPYETIQRHLKFLTRAEQVRLMSELTKCLHQHETERDASILELQGLGKEIWQGIAAQEYVDRERASWGG
jgi:hypothetical protein